eukprot:jgi/Bigna1/87948/estExt_fgenesh1_pg.C_260065
MESATSRSIFLGLLCAILYASEAIQQPGSYLQSSDKARMKDFLLGTSKTSTAQSFFVSSSLMKLTGSTDTKSACKSISSTFSDDSIEDIYYSVKLGCKIKMTTKRISTIQTALDASEAFPLYLAASAAHLSKTASKFKFDKAKKTLTLLKNKDGSFKATKDSAKSDAASTAFAMAAASLLDMPKDKSSLAALLKFGKKVGGELYFTSPGRNRLATTSLVLEVAVTYGIGEKELAAISSFLVASKYVQDAEDIYNLLTALNSCSSNAKVAPIVLTVADGVAASTDVLGNTVKAAIKPTKATDRSTKKPVSIPEKMTNGKLPSLKPGIYDVEFEVKPSSGKQSARTTSRMVKSTASVKPKSIALYVGKSSKLSGKEEKFIANFPATFSEDILADESKYILFVKLSFEGSGLQEQVFLQFNHAGSGKSVIFVMNPGKKTYNLKLNLGSSEFTENAFGPGTYTLKVLVGGVLLKESFSWTLGDIEITWPPSTPQKVENPLAKKKEIQHIFNEPPKQPNFMISLFFTLVCLSPLGIIYHGIGVLGMKLELPSSQKLWAMGFQLSLASIVVLNLCYFLFLNTVEALICLCVLSIPAVITGNQALNYLNTIRQKRKLKDE